MIVLSLFDGMSCGQIALKELGAHVERYYASEVDKFAIAQTQLNFPETIQLGDVRNIDARKLGNGWTVEVIKHILSFLPKELLKGYDMKEDENKQSCCGNCTLCVHTYLGSECGLTDNAVSDCQPACIDYIPED